MGRVRARLPEALAAAFGVGWFLALGGSRVLDPRNLDWLGTGDRAQHLMGWLFFRLGTWALPLGRVDFFTFPVGTTVGFTDSNPLLAIPAKLVSPLLPLDFQYIGLWLGACFALQGWFGARVAAGASSRGLHRFLGGALFALSPVLVARLGHDTLCAHFSILALLAMNLAPAPDPTRVRRSLAAALAMTFVMGAVHPYLATMCAGLALALIARRWRVDGLLSRRAALRWAGALAGGLATVFLVLGYLTSAPSHGGSLGVFSLDLAAFVNPWEYGRLLPRLPATPGSWDGYAYLGSGVLGLVLLAVGLTATCGRTTFREPLRGALPAIALSLALAAYALSPVVRLAGREILDLRWLYRPVWGIVAPFRSSGRFVWPLYYLGFAAALLVILRIWRERPWLATAVLVAAVALQFVDLSRMVTSTRFPERRWRLENPAWQLAAGRYRHLVLHPALVVFGSGGTGEARGLAYRDDEHWIPFAYEAYALGMTFNSGYLARGRRGPIEAAAAALRQEVERGRLREDTVYVLHPASVASIPLGAAVCGALDGAPVCVAASAAGSFRDALAARQWPASLRPVDTLGGPR